MDLVQSSKCQTGLKWWVVGEPKPGYDFASIDQYLKNYDLNGTNAHKMQLEAVLLVPGSAL
jgi:hypothetical protein